MVNGQVAVEVAFQGATVASAHCQLTSDSCQLTIPSPQLWWPHGLGEQPLYDVTVTLLADGEPEVASRRTLDSTHKRIGLRTLHLDRHADEWGESFQFVVNGTPFFAKGELDTSGHLCQQHHPRTLHPTATRHRRCEHEHAARLGRWHL
ncbi:MAG: hypothetical protein HC804_05330 [Anaerolineae bacterium]|nr:hypothetical protein [Anaerolineae bacterium]